PVFDEPVQIAQIGLFRLGQFENKELSVAELAGRGLAPLRDGLVEGAFGVSPNASVTCAVLPATLLGKSKYICTMFAPGPHVPGHVADHERRPDDVRHPVR